VEVGVKCWVENYILHTKHHVSSAYLTFVAVDQSGKHLPVPQVVPETEEQKRRYEDAGRRREHRQAEMKRRQGR
jgi:acyl-CoA hydrolase